MFCEDPGQTFAVQHQSTTSASSGHLFHHLKRLSVRLGNDRFFLIELAQFVFHYGTLETWTGFGLWEVELG
jgi:hypothetical protein